MVCLVGAYGECESGFWLLAGFLLFWSSSSATDIFFGLLQGWNAVIYLVLHHGKSAPFCLVVAHNQQTGGTAVELLTSSLFCFRFVGAESRRSSGLISNYGSDRKSITWRSGPPIHDENSLHSICSRCTDYRILGQNDSRPKRALLPNSQARRVPLCSSLHLNSIGSRAALLAHPFARRNRHRSCLLRHGSGVIVRYSYCPNRQAHA